LGCGGRQFESGHPDEQQKPFTIVKGFFVLEREEPIGSSKRKNKKALRFA
jgi:hypothetical protein